MKLASENYDEYWKRGWTVVEEVFTEDEVDAISKLASQICDERLNNQLGDKHKTDHSENGQAAPRKLSRPFLTHQVFRNFILDQRMRALIEQLIGKPPHLMIDQIFMKPPHFGSANPYHQDNAYFRCHPDDEVLTSWIALDDVDEHNGCLRYIDDSHLGPILTHHDVPGEPHNKVPSDDEIDLDRESLAMVRKGGIVFHHSKALHTSHRNESDRWRRAYASHWVSADVTCDEILFETRYYKHDSELYEAALRVNADNV